MSYNTYQFGYSSFFDEDSSGAFPSQTNCTKNITVNDEVAWPVVMREFANFLSSIYGYDISAQLLIEEWDGNHTRVKDAGV